jgi:hypothetical protein
MVCHQDLEAIDYFPVDSGFVLRAVGWLGTEHEFPTGKVTQQFFNKLNELAENPWKPLASAGFHVCELCQFQDYEHTARGINNLFIPFNNVIYVAPELIVHYINGHNYLPPLVFLDAVMKCPNMQSMDYKKSLLKNGGRGLSKLAKI